jgi:hypothetical protein
MKFRVLAMMILLFAAAYALAQDQGPINTPRINSTYYVGSLSGLQFYPTIQSAVTDACASGEKSVVDIPASYTGSDPISGVTGGCTNAVIKDEHNGLPTVCYAWNSTSYTINACTGGSGLPTTGGTMSGAIAFSPVSAGQTTLNNLHTAGGGPLPIPGIACDGVTDDSATINAVTNGGFGAYILPSSSQGNDNYCLATHTIHFTHNNFSLSGSVIGTNQAGTGVTEIMNNMPDASNTSYVCASNVCTVQATNSFTGNANAKLADLVSFNVPPGDNMAALNGYQAYVTSATSSQYTFNMPTTIFTGSNTTSSTTGIVADIADCQSGTGGGNPCEGVELHNIRIVSSTGLSSGVALSANGTTGGNNNNYFKLDGVFLGGFAECLTTAGTTTNAVGMGVWCAGNSKTNANSYTIEMGLPYIGGPYFSTINSSNGIFNGSCNPSGAATGAGFFRVWTGAGNTFAFNAVAGCTIGVRVGNNTAVAGSVANADVTIGDMEGTPIDVFSDSSTAVVHYHGTAGSGTGAQAPFQTTGYSLLTIDQPQGHPVGTNPPTLSASGSGSGYTATAWYFAVQGTGSGSCIPSLAATTNIPLCQMTTSTAAAITPSAGQNITITFPSQYPLTTVAGATPMYTVWRGTTATVSSMVPIATVPASALSYTSNGNETNNIAITGLTGTGPGVLSFTNTGTNNLTAGYLIDLSGFTSLAANLNGTYGIVSATGLSSTTFQLTTATTVTGTSSGVGNARLLTANPTQSTIPAASSNATNANITFTGAQYTNSTNQTYNAMAQLSNGAYVLPATFNVTFAPTCSQWNRTAVYNITPVTGADSVQQCLQTATGVYGLGPNLASVMSQVTSSSTALGNFFSITDSSAGTASTSLGAFNVTGTAAVETPVTANNQTQTSGYWVLKYCDYFSSACYGVANNGESWPHNLSLIPATIWTSGANIAGTRLYGYGSVNHGGVGVSVGYDQYMQFGSGADPAATLYFGYVPGTSTGLGHVDFTSWTSGVNLTQVIPTGSLPTMAPGAAAGSSPTCTAMTGVNMSGTLTCVTGTGTTTGILTTISFNPSVATAPIQCSLTPASATTIVPAGSVVWVSAPTTSGWVINVGGAALTASNSYRWSYSCQ